MDHSPSDRDRPADETGHAEHSEDGAADEAAQDALRETENAVGPPPEGPTIVGIGASAGGLAALRTFFKHVPEDSGLAYVIVVHLSPEHESHLAELLQPHVKMPVQQVSGEMPLRPDRVYVIPPNANLNTIDTHLRLSSLEKRRRERAPIDHFFRTLARTHDGHAIAVVLTGTGSDGTLGVKEIKEKGGLTVVQDPTEAEYDGMPQSAVATGVVDLILPLDDIPEAILRYASTEPRLPIPEDEEPVESTERQLLQKVFAQLRARTGRDFSRYKRSTILRRIQRRMQLRSVVELADYLNILREESEEVRSLADDLLITVTNFFRDPEVFEALERDVIPQLFGEKGPDDDIRVWSVGCATGEEAYSLAILLMEQAARHEAEHGTLPRLQIFASDLHDRSLAKAREGFYPGDIETDVSPERIKRFFQKEDGGFRIRKEVREMVVFAPHNLLGDPPFSKLDLIACRNVMIYLQRSVQQDVVDLFHYALRPSGFLVLGTSETVDSSNLFQTADKKRCVYRKRNVPAPEPRLPVFPVQHRLLPREKSDGDHAGEPIAYGMLHQRMVEQYAPPSILVNPDDRVVHLSDHAGRYLVHPGGEPTTSVFKLVREELRIELRSALHSARERETNVRTKPISVQFDGGSTRVVVDVRPAYGRNQEGFCLVIFDEREPDEGRGAAPAIETSGASPEEDHAERETERRELETELGLSQQRLQAIIEEYETSQEELRASNEELQSSNEELRSTLEELETSKEELQSMNEELQTVNQENRHKVEELAQLSGDLQNLMAATEIATLFLDRQLRILRFTPRIGELFNVRPADRGRPLSDLTHRLGYDELGEDARRVLDRLTPIEREVQDEAGRWYLTRVLPHRSPEDRIEGVVITFVDITTRKEAEIALRQSEEEYRRLFDSMDEGFFVIDVLFDESGQPYDLHYVEANPAATRIVGEDFAGRNLSEIAPDFEPYWYEIFGRVAETGEPVRMERYAAPLDAWFSFYVFRIGAPEDGRVANIFQDITERKQTEEALRESEERLRLTLYAVNLGVWSFDPETGTATRDGRFYEIYGYHPPSGEEHLDDFYEHVHPDDLDRVRAAVEACLREEHPYSETFRIVRPDGDIRWVHSEGRLIRTNGDESATMTGVVQDITERKQAEAALRQSEERYRLLVESATEYAILMLDTDGRIVSWNRGAERIFGYSEEEALRQPGAITFTEADREVGLPEKEMVTAVREGQASSDRWHVRKDGERFWASGVIAALRYPDGTLHGFAKVLRDNTDRKRTEERLRWLNETLEARVHERTEQVRELASTLAMAEQDERRRIAQILHDDLQQLLFGIQLKMTFVRSDAEEAGLASLAEHASESEGFLDRAIQVSRELTVDLSPPVLSGEGLTQMLQWLTTQMQEVHHLNVEIDAEDAFVIPQEGMRVLLFQIVRELLFNVVKHAGTERATVSLDRADDGLIITVADEGAGFDPESLKPKAEGGFGLFSVRERLRLFGGTLEIDSAPGAGTRMTAILPAILAPPTEE